MTPEFTAAISAGIERLAAWSELLDRINIFPIADGDTGRNLVLSMSPLKTLPSKTIIKDLLLSARGNSGNIAAGFFSGFISNDPQTDYAKAVSIGRKQAYDAIPDPRKGTMLDIYDALEETAVDYGSGDGIRKIIKGIEKATRATMTLNPKLTQANVVDSGALGMFIFFDAFLNALWGMHGEMKNIAKAFGNRLTVSRKWHMDNSISGSCIDLVVKFDDASAPDKGEFSRFDENAVAIRHEHLVKIHLHAESSEKVRDSMSKLGTVIQWAEDDLSEQTARFARSLKPVLHIVTDAAGSVTRNDAAELGFTLLESYATLGKQNMPETCMEPRLLYSAMRKGVKASTAQASVFERHQHYERILSLNEKALYLCVGSAYTGNYQVVTEWKSSNDPEDRLTVIDTGAASGRLGMIALAVARFSLGARRAEDVIDFAGRAVNLCQEYIFVDKLQYLVAGGRVSKASGFFADLLSMKPVVSPLPDGVKKMGVVRNRKEQAAYALKMMGETLNGQPGIIMVEYTDNLKWLKEEVIPSVRKTFDNSEIMLQPLSLTSGVHIGPGAWAVALMPRVEGLEIRPGEKE